MVADGRIETRSVETGILAGGDIEILKGLAKGERVVSLAGTFVRDGDLVTPVEADTKAAEIRP